LNKLDVCSYNRMKSSRIRMTCGHTICVEREKGGL